MATLALGSFALVPATVLAEAPVDKVRLTVQPLHLIAEAC